MADIIDVQNTLVSYLASILFPPGYLNGAASTTLFGPTVRLYPGLSDAKVLDADLQAGTANVTVFTEATPARLTTRHMYDWQTQSTPAPTLLVSVTDNTTVAYDILEEDGATGFVLENNSGVFVLENSGTGIDYGYTVTFSGTCATSNIAGIQLNNYAPVSYRCVAGDTPSTVAANLAAQLSWANPIVIDATITFPNNFTVVARTGADAVSNLETRLQEQVFRITVWAPNPTIRSVISSAIDSAMAYTRSLALPDGSFTNIPLYRGTYVDDVPEDAHLFRRDFKYAIEYPTIFTQTQTPALFPYSAYDVAPVLENFPSSSYATEDGVNDLTFVSGNPVEAESGPNE